MHDSCRESAEPHQADFLHAESDWKDLRVLTVDSLSISSPIMNSASIKVDLDIIRSLSVSQLMDKANWTTFTLTETEVHTAIFIDVILLALLGIGIQVLYGEKKVYSANKEEDKKLRKKARRVISWASTFVNSLFMTVMGIVYVVIKTDCLTDVSRLWTYAQGDGEHVWRSMDNISVLTMIWFGFFNIFEVTYGCVYCKEHLDPLTAWVHHPVFTWIVYMGTTGNGIFFTGRPFASSFMIVTCEELPTWLLAAGAMYPALRTDWGFGISFFVLRICFHFYHLVMCFLHDPAPSVYSVTTPKMIFLFSFLLHCMWFQNWVSKYLAPLIFGKKTAKPKTA